MHVQDGCKHQVVDYLTHTSVTLGGDMHRYKVIWTKRLKLGMNDTIDNELLLHGLKLVNHDLIEGNSHNFKQCSRVVDAISTPARFLLSHLCLRFLTFGSQ